MLKDFNRIAELCKLILKHNEHYHKEDAPKITDAEYDGLLVELRQLERKYPDRVTENSPTQTVGFKADERFTKTEHLTPMFSLNNVFDDSGLIDFDAKITKSLKANPLANGVRLEELVPRYVAELKFDGLSMNLIYKKSGRFAELVDAITRGDGETGESVIHVARFIRGIPFVLRDKYDSNDIELLEVRGEVVMPYEDFERVNKALREAGKDELVNPRNAAAGSVRQMDPQVTKERGVEFIAYGIGKYEEKRKGFVPDTQHGVMAMLDDFGFNTSKENRFVATDIHELVGFYGHVRDIRPVLPFGIDGIVVKLNNRTAQDIVGYTSNAPRFAIAYKYAAEEAITVLEDITVQIGRTGAVTPVGRLKRVFVGGVFVENATLHNVERIDAKGVLIGDKVVVRRAGDVVPEIVGPVPSFRTGNERKFVMPTHCPDCGSLLELDNPKAKIYRCSGGMKCPEQKYGIFCNAVSRNAFNIVGLGEETISELMTMGLLDDLHDIFDLRHEDLLLVEGFKDKSIVNLMSAIEKAKRQPVSRFLLALGIRHVGASTAKLLAKNGFGPIEIEDAARDELLAIDGIGPETADALIDYFSEYHREFAELLKRVELDYSEGTVKSSLPQTLAGTTFVITGSFPGKSREEIKESLEAGGGKVSGSISKKTNVLIAGHEASASKLSMANKLGIMILDFIPESITWQV